MAKCSNCGAELMPDKKFCTACGTKISAEDEAALLASLHGQTTGGDKYDGEV